MNVLRLHWRGGERRYGFRHLYQHVTLPAIGFKLMWYGPCVRRKRVNKKFAILTSTISSEWTVCGWISNFGRNSCGRKPTSHSSVSLTATHSLCFRTSSLSAKSFSIRGDCGISISTAGAEWLTLMAKFFALSLVRAVAYSAVLKNWLIRFALLRTMSSASDSAAAFSRLSEPLPYVGIDDLN